MKRAAMLVCLLAIPGCSGGILAPSGPAPGLYTLSPPAQVSTPATQVNWQLLIDMPSAPLDLNSSRIAIAPAPDRIDYYADVAWVDRVPPLLQALILESFDRSGRIAAVQRQGGGLRADYVLATELRDFEVDATQPNSAAHLRLTARLVRMRDRSIVASRTFEATGPAVGSGIDTVVASFNGALGDILPQIVTWALTTGSQSQ